MLRFAQARLCPPSIEQRAAIAAYKMGIGYFEPVRQEYERRRDVLYEGLAAHPGRRRPQAPGRVLYERPPADQGHRDVRPLHAQRLPAGRRDGHGRARGRASTRRPGKGLDEVRIAYVLGVEKIKRAIEILRAGLEKYTKLFG